MTEVWAPVPGWEGYYEVSTHGRVRSVERQCASHNGTTRKVPQRIMKLTASEYGHLRVTLSRGGKIKTYGVHRLVLLAFVGPPPEGTEACHSNGIANDNRLENLRWDTSHSNSQDTIKHGRQHRKLSPEDVIKMRDLKRKTGISYKDLAAMFGCSITSAQKAIVGETYAWLSTPRQATRPRKTDQETAQAIRRVRAETGMSYEKLAAMFGCGVATAYRVVTSSVYG